MISSFPLIHQMYKKMNYENFENTLDEMILNNNYKMVAGYNDDKMIAVAGYWVARMLYCGRYLQACNLIVDENLRNQGVGKKILHYLEDKARKLDCDKMVLDSYTENKKSHSLYFAENFYIRGFHFMKDLK